MTTITVIEHLLEANETFRVTACQGEDRDAVVESAAEFVEERVRTMESEWPDAEMSSGAVVDGIWLPCERTSLAAEDIRAALQGMRAEDHLEIKLDTGSEKWRCIASAGVLEVRQIGE